ncbi:MAG: 16S rRNA (cytosine(967)-C(5))-methyltransferase RsmB [Thioalkalivibrionaceae bacterium]
MSRVRDQESARRPARAMESKHVVRAPGGASVDGGGDVQAAATGTADWCARRSVYEILSEVLLAGRSASAALERGLPAVAVDQRSWVQALTLTALRFAPRLELLIEALLDKPLRARDRGGQVLLIQGLAELFHFGTPDHAAVRETVALTRTVGLAHLTGLINAVLRRAAREREALSATLDRRPESLYALPGWWLRQMRRDWPQRWSEMAALALDEAPMTLRVNLARGDRGRAIAALEAAGIEAAPHPLVSSALTLSAPCSINRLPGFAEGLVTVQDAAAQLAAWLVAPEPGDRILDACAAPGGKTGHLLEMVDGEIALIAVEIDGIRMARVEENLARLGYVAHLAIADLAAIDEWWDGRPFDRILLDAPCSASGVLRRHPDIKWLRRADDPPALAQRQAELLRMCWTLLRPGGRLVYATCSMFDIENVDVVAGFLRSTPDAAERSPAILFGEPRAVGRAIALGDLGMDGFYYAVLEKVARDEVGDTPAPGA